MKKMLTLTMILSILLIGCSTERNTELEESINAVVEDLNNEEVHINTLTTFEWEEAHLFQPYTTKETMEEQLGFKYRDKSNIAMLDSIFLLVFIKDDKAVQYAEIKRKGAELSMGEQDYLTPTSDVLYISRY